MVEVQVPVGAFDGQSQPRHVVVIVVGPAAAVADPDAAQQPVGVVGDVGVEGAVRADTVDRGVDEQVDEVCLPPVMPGSELGLHAPDGPGDGSGTCPRQPEGPLQVTVVDGVRGGLCAGVGVPQVRRFGLFVHVRVA